MHVAKSRIGVPFDDAPDFWEKCSALEGEVVLLRSLIDSTTEAICGVDSNGICRFINITCCTLLGYRSADEVIGQSIHGILVRAAPGVPLSQQGARPISRTLSTGEACHIQDEFCRRKDGSSFPVEYRAYPMYDGQSIAGATVTFVDATSQATREYQLELCTEAVDSALNAVLFTTQGGTILYANKAALELWGYEDDTELIGRNISQLAADPAEQAVVIKHLLLYGRWRGQVRPIRKDGTRFDAFLSAIQVHTRIKGSSYLVASFVDLTEKVEIEREIQRIETEERRRIGHDLHDDLGQLLTGLSMKTQCLRAKMGEEQDADLRILDEIALLLDGAKNRVREAARGLTPIPPYDFGLVLALKNLARQTETLYGIPTILEERDTPNIPDPQIRAQLFRIAQEALNNAVQHADAMTITIRLLRNGARLELAVSDDGKGFDTRRISKGGMGLRIMEYRARSINGVFVLSSDSVSGGTTVACSLSLDNVPRAIRRPSPQGLSAGAPCRHADSSDRSAVAEQ